MNYDWHFCHTCPIQNSKWLSQDVIHKKNQIGSVPTIDGWIAIVTVCMYVFKNSCSQVHDKKSQQKYGEHLTSDFLFQGLYQ